ncbi:MAG: hypothetical protein M1814_000625 [Vezdaea aestivalis]|nr:MAG: hypothetical protein M1814_000625 [Vezdaea aestivalis]
MAPQASDFLEFQRLQRAYFDTRLANKEFNLFVHPLGSIPTLILIAHLLVPWPKYPQWRFLRFPIFGLILWLSAYIQFNFRSPHKAIDFGVGLLNAWTICWSATLMLFTNPQATAKRIKYGTPEKADVPRLTDTKGSGSETGDSASTPIDSKSNHDSPTSALRQRAFPNGHSNLPSSSSHQDRPGPILYWQSFPQTSLSDRIDWTLDLISNFRGVGWMHQVSAIPPLPAVVREALDKNAPYPSSVPETGTTSFAGLTRYPTRGTLLRGCLPSFIAQYLLLDMIKTAMMHDPHFWGVIPSPSPYPLSPLQTHIYRTLLSFSGIYIALSTIFLSVPVLLALSPFSRPQEYHYLLSPLSHPSAFGSIRSISSHGLAAFWAHYWHQMFRVAFAAPSNFLIPYLPYPHSHPLPKALQLLTAFLLSGFLHAAGSHTQMPQTYPLTGPMAFFLLQAVGIAVQIGLSGWLGKMEWGRARRWIRGLGNWTFVLGWMFATSHLLTNDFARGGIWLFEPVPVSFARGLGWGPVKDEGWWVWGGEWLRWSCEERWWMCGVAG